MIGAVLSELNHLTKEVSMDTDMKHDIAHLYITQACGEAELYKVWYTVNLRSGRTVDCEVEARDCYSLLIKLINDNSEDVDFITVGCARNHVTLHRSGVSSVIFYECFYLPPEEHELKIQKQAYDYVCAKFLTIADVYALTHAEYEHHVATGAFKAAFDKRKKTTS